MHSFHFIRHILNGFISFQHLQSIEKKQYYLPCIFCQSSIYKKTIICEKCGFFLPVQEMTIEQRSKLFLQYIEN
jgi:hypothetical protein